MNPTTTEHDFRFPRRPLEDDKDGPAPHLAGKSADLRANLQHLTLDLASTYTTAQDELLRSSVFPPFQDSAGSLSQSPEELQRLDPLATQVWRFFTKTKQLLPAQERMENLTWRMMHMNLRRRRQQEESR
jgi:GATA-binding protein